MKAFLTILLLICSNVLMTFAWYGNLKLKEMRPSQDWPLYVIILVSWGIALFEYCFMIPANRIGSKITGGPFTLMQLKIIQEAISLIVFTAFSTMLFNGESLHWNHVVAFVLVLAAVAFAFIK
ncbi:MAG: DMT family protein [Paludibacteraceae bacterium]|nr:DMT family protein [Paludibacteraceae bacterium]MEE1083218.1 DMT family protein [Paludibacteraceae bacterium]